MADAPEQPGTASDTANRAVRHFIRVADFRIIAPW